MAALQTIRKKKEFTHIFQNGKNIKNGFLVAKVLKNALGENRFAFMVSQKVSKKAVVRNKVRRRLLEACRAYGAPENGQGVDVVFVALPGAEHKDFSQITQAVAGVLDKATN